MSKIKIRKNDKRIKAFTAEVTGSLLTGKRYQIPGFGTFSTCARKATAERAACKMAMFRASAELRDYAAGGPQPDISGQHLELIRDIVAGMQTAEGVDIPNFGHMAIIPESGKKSKIIFHSAKELNKVLEKA